VGIVSSVSIVIGDINLKCKKRKMRRILVDLNGDFFYRINKVLLVLFWRVVCD